MNRERFLRAIATMGSQVEGGDVEMSTALIDAGFGRLESDLLVALTPMAFSRPILEELGVNHFVDSVSAKNKHDQWVQVPLASLPIYAIALKMAREHRRTGVLDNRIFKALALRSAELNAADKALNAGVNIKGATAATCLVALRVEDLVPTTWLARLRRSILGRIGSID